MKFTVKGVEYGSCTKQTTKGNQYRASTNYHVKPYIPTYYWSVTESNTKLTFGTTKLSDATDSGILNIKDINNIAALSEEAWHKNYKTTITTVEFKNNVPFEGNIIGMFQGFAALTTFISLENFNVSEVTDLSYTFRGTQALTSLDLKFLQKANKVTKYAGFLAVYSGVTPVLTTITNFDQAVFANDISTAEDFLSGQSVLTSFLNFSNMFNHMSPAVNTKNMFYNVLVQCVNFQTPVTVKFITGRNMFTGVKKGSVYTQLNLVNLDFSEMGITQEMFKDSTVTKIYVNDQKTFKLNKIANGTNMFAGCVNLPNYISMIVDQSMALIRYEDTSEYTTKGPTYLDTIACYYHIMGTTVVIDKNVTLPGSGFDDRVTQLGASISGFFQNCTQVIITEDITGLMNANRMFDNLPSLTKITGLEHLKSPLINTSSMFYWLDSQITEIDCSFLTWAQDTVMDMSDMFGFTYATLKNWQTLKFTQVKNLSGLFAYSKAAPSRTIDLRPFMQTVTIENISNIAKKGPLGEVVPSISFSILGYIASPALVNAKSAFQGIAGQGDLDLSQWDLSNLTNTEDMFYVGNEGLQNLQHIYVNPAKTFNLSKITNSVGMFFGNVNLPHYSAIYTDKTYAYIDDGVNGYLTAKTP